MPSVKKKIRDLERKQRKLLQQSQQDAPVSVLAKLNELKEQSRVNQLKVKEKKLSAKYHLVKFVERKKVTRKIRKLDVQLKTASPREKRVLEADRQRLESDLVYIMYYPKNLKYMAIFGGKGYGNGKEGEEEEEDEEEGDGGGASGTLVERETVLALAMEARKRDVENGNVDRVLHAIAVAANEHKSRVLAKDKKKSIGGGGGGGGGEGEEVDDDDDDDDDDREVGIEEVEALERAEEESLMRENSLRRRLANKEDEEETRKKKKRPRSETPGTSDTQVAEAAEVASKHEPDSFFMEEAGEGTVGGGEDAASSSGSSLHSNKKKKFENGQATKAFGGGRNRVPVPAPKSKQEARLMKWQSEKRGSMAKGRPTPSHAARSGPRGTFAAPTSAPLASSASFKRQDFSKVNKRSDGYNSSSNNTSNKHQQAKKPPYVPYERPKAAWEVGGGVSVSSMSEKVLQKQSGAIVKSAGKKIVFD